MPTADYASFGGFLIARTENVHGGAISIGPPKLFIVAVAGIMRSLLSSRVATLPEYSLIPSGKESV